MEFYLGGKAAKYFTLIRRNPDNKSTLPRRFLCCDIAHHVLTDIT